METYKVRNDKNEEFEVDQSKLLEAENDGYLPVVSNGKQEHRVSTRDFAKAKADGFKPITTSDIGGGEAAFRGGIAGVTAGFGDEIGGFMEAAGSKIGLRGVGSPNLMDIRLETDEEDKQDFGEVYRGMRDQRRGLEAEAKGAQPGAYLGGQIAGGVGVSMIPAVGALQAVKGGSLAAKALAGAKIGAIEGGLYGAGESEAEDVAGLAGDIAKGAAIGAGGGALAIPVMAGAGAVGRSIGKGAKNVGTRGIAFKRGFGEGMKEDAFFKIPFVEQGEKILKGIRKGLTEGARTGESIKEISEQAMEARKILIRPLQESPNMSKLEVIGNAKYIDELSDDEAILMALAESGDNKVKRWIAEKATHELPGDFKADDYMNILSMNPEDRIAARAFDKKKGALELKETMGGVQGAFKQARGERFGELQKEAAQVYDVAETNKVLETIEDSIGRAERLRSIPTAAIDKIESFKQKIIEGLGVPEEGFTPGILSEAAPGEHYLRLQKTRETIDKLIPWGKKEGLSDAVGEFKRIRNSIDDALKTAPGKSQADEMYKASVDIEDRFFGVAEFKANGKIDIDEFKLESLMGNRATAGRFRNSIEEFKDFAQRPDLSDDFKNQAATLVEELENKINTMDTKRDIFAFKMQQGPTSAAVERLPSVQRMQSGLGGVSPVQQAVATPAGFMNQMDEVIKSTAEKLGKPMSDFSPIEKRGMVKLWTWRNKNPDAGMKELEKQTMIFFPTLKKQKAIDDFLK